MGSQLPSLTQKAISMLCILVYNLTFQAYKKKGGSVSTFVLGVTPFACNLGHLPGTTAWFLRWNLMMLWNWCDSGHFGPCGCARGTATGEGAQ